MRIPDGSDPQLPAPTATPLGSVSKDPVEARSLVSSFVRLFTRSLVPCLSPSYTGAQQLASLDRHGTAPAVKLLDCSTRQKAYRTFSRNACGLSPPPPVTATSAPSASHSETNLPNPRYPGPVAATPQNFTLVFLPALRCRSIASRGFALLPEPTDCLSFSCRVGSGPSYPDSPRRHDEARATSAPPVASSTLRLAKAEGWLV